LLKSGQTQDRYDLNEWVATTKNVISGSGSQPFGLQVPIGDKNFKLLFGKYIRNYLWIVSVN